MIARRTETWYGTYRGLLPKSAQNFIYADNVNRKETEDSIPTERRNGCLDHEATRKAAKVLL